MNFTAQDFEEETKLSQGTYGEVFKAKLTKSLNALVVGQEVAIKKIGLMKSNGRSIYLNTSNIASIKITLIN